MKIKAFTNNPFQENCYIVSEGNEAVLIDCGAYFPQEELAIRTYLEQEGLTPVAHLLTHGHLDHVFGAEFVHTAWGIVPTIHPADAALYQGLAHQADMFGIGLLQSPCKRYHTLEGDELTVGSIHVQVVHTPGHTQGGVCYIIGEMVFTGDTLFAGGYGRTDLPGGNTGELFASLHKLSQVLPEKMGLPAEKILLLPGHGGATYLSREMY